MKSKRLPADQRGFTLIELIIFIVVVSVGMVGILQVMNTVVKSSADPVVRKQAMALAESILEEIMLKEYCDPDTMDATTTPHSCYVTGGDAGGARTVAVDQEALRANYDDVDDYNGQTQAVFLDWPANLPSYSVAITVGAPEDVGGVLMKQVTVAVTGGGNTISLTGFRANY